MQAIEPKEVILFRNLFDQRFVLINEFTKLNAIIDWQSFNGRRDNLKEIYFGYQERQGICTRIKEGLEKNVIDNIRSNWEHINEMIETNNVSAQILIDITKVFEQSDSSKHKSLVAALLNKIDMDQLFCEYGYLCDITRKFVPKKLTSEMIALVTQQLQNDYLVLSIKEAIKPIYQFNDEPEGVGRRQRINLPGMNEQKCKLFTQHKITKEIVDKILSKLSIEYLIDQLIVGQCNVSNTVDMLLPKLLLERSNGLDDITKDWLMQIDFVRYNTQQLIQQHFDSKKQLILPDNHIQTILNNINLFNMRCLNQGIYINPNENRVDYIKDTQDDTWYQIIQNDDILVSISNEIGDGIYHYIQVVNPKQREVGKIVGILLYSNQSALCSIWNKELLDKTIQLVSELLIDSKQQCCELDSQ